MAGNGMIISDVDRIIIDDVGTFEYDASEIRSLRPDIFAEGAFSIFDILAYLDSKDAIDMSYRYNKDLGTHVIESINEIEDWWYSAFYEGGWYEKSVCRMDMYPYKENMHVRIGGEDREYLKIIYEEYRKEISRKEGVYTAIVPKVLVRGKSQELLFTNVSVTSHNLRTDLFKKGVITAIDTILSLGDQGLLDYELGWYDSIRRAKIGSYFIDRINDDKAYGRCGFVYEIGSSIFERFIGNHIHISSDERVLGAPDYVEYFWVCL